MTTEFSRTFCKSGCCLMYTRPLIVEEKDRSALTKRRAGAILYNKDSDRVLIVQSEAGKWGPPKGHIEIGEKCEDGAIREVYEETGLDIRKTKKEVFGDTEKYFIYFLSISLITDLSPGDDVFGIGWVRRSCAKDLNLNIYGKMMLGLLK